MSNWKLSKCFWCSNRRRLNVKKVLNKNALVHSTQPSGFQVRGVTSPLLAESRARTSLSLRNNHWAWLKRPKFQLWVFLESGFRLSYWDSRSKPVFCFPDVIAFSLEIAHFRPFKYGPVALLVKRASNQLSICRDFYFRHSIRSRNETWTPSSAMKKWLEVDQSRWKFYGGYFGNYFYSTQKSSRAFFIPLSCFSFQFWIKSI